MAEIPVQVGGDRHKHAVRLMTGWRVDATGSCTWESVTRSDKPSVLIRPTALVAFRRNPNASETLITDSIQGILATAWSRIVYSSVFYLPMQILKYRELEFCP